MLAAIGVKGSSSTVSHHTVPYDPEVPTLALPAVKSGSASEEELKTQLRGELQDLHYIQPLVTRLAATSVGEDQDTQSLCHMHCVPLRLRVLRHGAGLSHKPTSRETLTQ